jgi:hypothetical protein
VAAPFFSIYFYPLNDLVICSNSDQAAHTWKNCMCIKGYTLKDKDNQTLLEDISIFVASKQSLETLCDIIKVPIKSNNIKQPKYPIIDTNYYRLRCLISVGIGCDVYLDGVPTITPKKFMIL